ncbi:CatB-related O-acetyltransferase [Parabacteroides sp. APC149_11_2_Y6]
MEKINLERFKIYRLSNIIALIYRILLKSDCLRYILYKIKYGKKLQCHYTSTIEKHSIFEGANRIYKHVYYSGELGFGSYIGAYSELKANIGRFTSIAPNVRCNTGIHPIATPYATTSPMFYSLKKQNGYTFAKYQNFNEFKKYVEIGNDVWIGENVFLSGGIRINDGAIILAGAVVTKDIPCYAIAGGIPAKVISYRYDAETIKFLLNIKWWEKDTIWLDKNWLLLNNIEKLKEYFQKR